MLRLKWMRIHKNKLLCTVLELITTLWKVYNSLVLTSKRGKIPMGKCMVSDQGQNWYSDFVPLETPLRFENCSSSHCLLFRGVGSMSLSRRSPRFIVLFSLGHCWFFLVALLWAYVAVASFLCLCVIRSSIHRLRYILGQVLDVCGYILQRLYLHKLGNRVTR